MKEEYYFNGRQRCLGVWVQCSRCGKDILRNKSAAIKNKSQTFYCSTECHVLSQREFSRLGDKKCCKKCNKIKKLDEFYQRRDYGLVGSVRSVCKQCASHKSKEFRMMNPERQSVAARLRRYGLTDKRFNEMLKEQHGLCAICGRPGKRKAKWCKTGLFVDHIHSSGKIRGLLCHQCNTGIGSFRDDINVVKRCVEYLLRYSKDVL
jgi:hypothetical protein